MRTTFIALGTALILAAGCKQETAAPPAAAAQQQTQPSLTPEQLGEIGAQIHRHPADAQKILAGRGITPEAFEKAVRGVAEDPAAARRYRDAYKKSG